MALDTKTTCLPQTFPCKPEDRLSMLENDFSYTLSSSYRSLNYRENSKTFDNAALRKSGDGPKLGGQGVVVLLDTFPLGYGKFREVRLSTNEVVLGFAELKEIPTRFHFEIFDEQTLPESIANSVRTLVHPSSTLIVDSFLYNILNDLLYSITTVEQLQKHDTTSQSVLNNLETVWKPVLDSCEDAEDILDVKNKLAAIMRRQRTC